jgi:hypothetical protein
MSDYRLYSVDGAGKIVAAEWLHARTDDEALHFARSLNKSSDCELWKRTKFVQSISASGQKERPLCE